MNKCIGCEGSPKPGNNPCAVCGLYAAPAPASPAALNMSVEDAMRIVRANWGDMGAIEAAFRANSAAPAAEDARASRQVGPTQDDNAIIAKHFADDPANAVRAHAALTECLSARQQGALSESVVLPDGSAFFTASLPLGADHWLYAPQCAEWDNERDTPADTPRPILDNSHREAVKAAVRYAIRGATMNGKEMDFDPDALVLNAAYALCGPLEI